MRCKACNTTLKPNNNDYLDELKELCNYCYGTVSTDLLSSKKKDEIDLLFGDIDDED